MLAEAERGKAIIYEICRIVQVSGDLFRFPVVDPRAGSAVFEIVNIVAKMPNTRQILKLTPRMSTDWKPTD
jgi:hypothetical protein